MSLSFVRDLLKRCRNIGDVIPKPHAGGRARKIAGADALILRECIRQRTAFVNLTGQTVSVGLSLRRLGFTRKKKTVRAREAPSEAIQEARDAFQSCQVGLPTARLHVLDENRTALPDDSSARSSADAAGNDVAALLPATVACAVGPADEEYAVDRFLL